MKKRVAAVAPLILAVFMPTCTIAMAGSGHAAKPRQDHTAKPTPAYAKWGELAVAETKKRYPKASVIDYLHVGRQAISPSTTQETFKLWLKGQRREFGVFVRIQFDTTTERVLSIRFQETDR
ncbi:MAG: YqzG/YhdC family protein [Alicyclobacillus sp.]|nr:YqzG/YhdC family protein [Alicyclobacillus sp.]